MTKQEFLDGLKDIVIKAEKDKNFLDVIVDDVTSLLDDYDNEASVEDEDDEEY